MNDLHPDRHKLILASVVDRLEEWGMPIGIGWDNNYDTVPDLVNKVCSELKQQQPPTPSGRGKTTEGGMTDAKRQYLIALIDRLMFEDCVLNTAEWDSLLKLAEAPTPAQPGEHPLQALADNMQDGPPGMAAFIDEHIHELTPDIPNPSGACPVNGGDHRWVGNGEYGDPTYGHMCGDCGLDIDDLDDASRVEVE